MLNFVKKNMKFENNLVNKNSRLSANKLNCQSKVSSVKYPFNGTDIKDSPCNQYLGVIVDRKLSLPSHSELATKKSSKQGSIGKLRHFFHAYN